MKLQLAARVVAAAVFGLVFSTVAQAQATRTWVSGVGDDVNPCSRTAPCKTFAGAISKTATNGVISVLDPGGFGAVTITKSITIDGGGIRGSILSSLVTGIIVNPAANSKVVIKNIDIDGAGNGTDGIRVVGSVTNLALHVDNVRIANINGDGIDYPTASNGGHLYVQNTTIRNVVSNGIFVSAARATLDNVHVEASGKGVLGGAGALINAKNTVVTGNGEGFASTNPTAVFNLQDSWATHNQFGISASGGSTFRLSNCGIFTNSNTGLFNSASSIISLGGNSIQGNPTPGSFTSTVPPS